MTTDDQTQRRALVVFALAVLCGLVAALLIWLLIVFLGISDSDLSVRARATRGDDGSFYPDW